MSWLLNMTAAIWIVTAFGIIAAARSRLRETTLLTAWNWALVAAITWAGTQLWSAMPEGWYASHVIREQAWYATAVLSVCPSIAVLGARRPRAKAWMWFVLFPLIAVLGWPMLTVWAIASQPVSLHVETPHVLGWLLVLLMGAGNYMGTKYWDAACLYAVALVLLVAPLSAASPAWLAAEPARATASIAVSLAVLSASWKSGRALNRQPSWDHLVEDYRNCYGIVWGRRLQDRLNAVARQRGWPVVLTPGGFAWEDGVSDNQRRDTTVQIEQCLRWMLRPFVTPEWIDRRLNSPEELGIH